MSRPRIILLLQIAMYILIHAVGTIHSEDSVSLLIGLDKSVILYNTSDRAKPRTLMDPNSVTVTRLDYHYTKNLLFAYVDKNLYRSPLFKAGKLQGPSLVVEMGECPGFAVDWIQDRIFWAGCSNDYASINVVDIEGNDSTTIVKWADKNEISHIVVDPCSRLVFWLRNHILESSGENGENVRTNLTKSKNIEGIALDIPNQRLFYIQNNDFKDSLFSYNYIADNITRHFSIPDGFELFGFAFLKGFFYWITSDGTDVLFKASLKTSIIRKMDYFQSTDIWDFKVLDPELQIKPSKCPVTPFSGSRSSVKANKRFVLDQNLMLKWHAAYTHCRKQGKNLATIMNKKENDDMVSYIRTLYDGPEYPSIWLGGRTTGSKTAWKWLSTKRSINFTDWMPGQPDPDKHYNKEDCLGLWSRGSDTLKWNDGNCKWKQLFLCEYKE